MITFLLSSFSLVIKSVEINQRARAVKESSAESRTRKESDKGNFYELRGKSKANKSSSPSTEPISLHALCERTN